MLEFGALIIICSLICLIHANIYEKKKGLASIGIVLAVLACVYGIIKLIFNLHMGTILTRILESISMEAAFFAFYSLIARVDNIKPSIRYVKNGVYLAAVCINIYDMVQYIAGISIKGVLLRLYAILWVIVVVGTISLIVLRRIYKSEETDDFDPKTKEQN